MICASPGDVTVPSPAVYDVRSQISRDSRGDLSAKSQWNRLSGAKLDDTNEILEIS